MHHWQRMLGLAAVLGTACVPAAGTGGLSATSGRVRPGITVLLEDSLHLVRGRRIGLITNQTGVDERGQSDIDLLRGSTARGAGVQLAVLFSPERGIRGTEDREQIASGVDERSGLTIHSLYTNTTIAPPDSTLRGLDALVFDLQDIGTRTWTYTGLMVYALRASARNRLPLIVLDRPNPLTGAHADGPLLDTALSNTEEHRPDRPGKAYALYPFPLRHGMTMGEMALFYNTVLGLGAPLHVVPAAGWERGQWFDQTALPWVRPSPNLPTLTSALVYPSLVAFEASRLSVGRGTSDAFQRFGAPWLQAERAAALLNERDLAGVRFEVSPFTPTNPGDRKYDGVRIPGVRVVVTDRDRVHSGRLGAAIIWAVAQTTPPESLQIRPRAFDERFGSSAAREALLRGEDPDAVIDRHLPAVVAFQRDADRFRLYR